MSRGEPTRAKLIKLDLGVASSHTGEVEYYRNCLSLLTIAGGRIILGTLTL